MWEPATDFEGALRVARTRGDPVAYRRLVEAGRLLLPTVGAGGGERWATWTTGGRVHLLAFTSPEALHACLGAGEVGYRLMTLDELTEVWPDPTWWLAVDPGLPIGGVLPPPPAAVRHAAPVAAEVTIMQKPLGPGYVRAMLDHGYDRVNGFVHRLVDVAHLATPAAMCAALGLDALPEVEGPRLAGPGEDGERLSDGEPFDPADEAIHVLRWPSHRPGLYRVPAGGADEAAAAAVDGWVVERPPFAGTGFAPSRIGDAVPEYKVDSVRLPHGAQIFRLYHDYRSVLVATYDADTRQWRRFA